MLWKYGVEIDFTYRTFKWHNEVKGVADVSCVIIGFRAKGGDIGDHEDNGDISGAGAMSSKSSLSPESPIPNRARRFQQSKQTPLFIHS